VVLLASQSELQSDWGVRMFLSSMSVFGGMSVSGREPLVQGRKKRDRQLKTLSSRGTAIVGSPSQSGFVLCAAVVSSNT